MRAERFNNLMAANKEPAQLVSEAGTTRWRTTRSDQRPNTLTLKKGNYVSATLVWDRDVQLDSGADEYQRGDTFTDFGFEDLNLYLVPAGMDRSHAVAKSISTAFNLEHIFAPVPSDGDYTLLVALDEFEGGPVNYALAWWAGADAAKCRWRF